MEAPVPVDTTSPTAPPDPPTRAALPGRNATQRHGALGQVEATEPLSPVAEHEQAGGAVVGDRVDDVDVPAGDPAVHDLQRGHHVGGGGGDLGRADHAAGQVLRQHERDLGLDLGLQGAGTVDRRPRRAGHALEQHAEVGPVDAELRLHGRIGQPDLPADDAGARRDLIGDPGRLHGVGGVDVPGRQQAPDRGTGLPGGARGHQHLQRLGRVAVRRRVHDRHTQLTSKVVPMPMPVIHSGTAS